MSLACSSGDLYCLLGSASDTMGDPGKNMLKMFPMLAELESHFQKYLYGCNVKTRGRQSSGMIPTSVHPADSPVAVVPV